MIEIVGSINESLEGCANILNFLPVGHISNKIKCLSSDILNFFNLTFYEVKFLLGKIL